MRVPREFFHNPKDLPLDEFLSPGTSLCAGCGALAALRLVHKVLGGRIVIVNAAGCLTLLATYPFTPLRSSWLYTTMGSPSAGAQGIRDALDILKARGELGTDDCEDLHVLVLAGDGSTYEMGMSSTSAAMHRQLDFWYLCYDNEAYGNTGFQTSAASPAESHTTTWLDANNRRKKDIFGIWLAHQPPYAATICSHDPIDLAEKVRRGMSIHGPKMLLSLAVCPTGWGFEPERSDEIAKLAIETGVWPLKEALHGEVRHTYIPNRFRPIEEYLAPQRRFRHLFEPRPNHAALQQMQSELDRYWNHVKATEMPRVAT
jgi:pyruvate ferredoxin oxidoreductase beta subunit